MVDDDAEDRELLKDTFEDLGYGNCFDFQENGEKAIGFLKVCLAERYFPCLIILDLNMPKLNGRQTLQAIKQDAVLQHIPVIIYSTSLNPLERDECMALGAYSYVVKPVSYKEALETATTFYQFCNENEKTVIAD